MTSESTRFLGHPNEIKPTVGAVGWETLLTLPLYRELGFLLLRRAGRAADVLVVSVR